MIVTKFKALSAEVCSGRYVIERDSKTPGKVDLICKESGIRMALPAHADQVADFVKAYIYLTQEDIGYRTVDVP